MTYQGEYGGKRGLMIAMETTAHKKDLQAVILHPP
jgi:hypothetical protein